MAPCNCGKQAKTTWSYTSAEGQTTTNLSEVQAKAMKIRAGGKGVVQQK
jgi:hypothetical protein